MSSLKKTEPSAQNKLPQDVLEQYLFGTLTEAQRHQVERQLLDDALTAEATEGLATQKSAEHMAANMADLHERLHNRIALQEERRHIRLPFGLQPYAIAASVGVLLVSAVVVLFSLQYLEKKEKPTDTLAAQLEKKPAPAAAMRPAVTDSIVVSANAIVSEKNLAAAEPKGQSIHLNDSHSVLSESSHWKIQEPPQTEKKANHYYTVAPSYTTKADSNRIAALVQGRTAGIEVLPEKVAAVDNALGSKETNTFKSRMNVTPESQMMATMDKSSSPATDVRIVKGKVTDVEDGLGIPGVVVTVPGTTVTAVTDRNGMYQIAVPVSQNELSFNFIGYLTYSSPINEQPVLNAKLMPDVKTLGEVIVVTGTTKPGEPATAYQAAQPTNPDFIKVIEQKLEASPNVLSHGNPGSIKLSFTVQPDGSLTDVKVLKGVCAECDAIAVKALQESSQWKPARENGKPVSQTMRIRIPLKKKKK